MDKALIIEELQAEMLTDRMMDEATLSDIDCPDCKEKLYMYTAGSHPDDIVTYLFCKNCGYKEQE